MRGVWRFLSRILPTPGRRDIEQEGKALHEEMEQVRGERMKARAESKINAASGFRSLGYEGKASALLTEAREEIEDAKSEALLDNFFGGFNMDRGGV